MSDRHSPTLYGIDTLVPMVVSWSCRDLHMVCFMTKVRLATPHTWIVDEKDVLINDDQRLIKC